MARNACMYATLRCTRAVGNALRQRAFILQPDADSSCNSRDGERRLRLNQRL